VKVRSGFTLVEILIVVVILGILAAIVIPHFADADDTARDSQIKTDIQTVRRVVELYKAQHDGKPPHLSESGATDDRVINLVSAEKVTLDSLQP